MGKLLRRSAFASVVTVVLVVPVSVTVSAARSVSTFHAVAGGTINAVTCASATRCVAAGTGITTTRISNNGGTSWQRAATPINGVANSISCPTTTLCVAVGSTFNLASGAAWRSTDGGNTWSTKPVPHVHPLQTVSCASASRCLADGLLSTNGGTSWATHSFPVGGFACDKGGSGHCIGVTSGDNVYYSTNAGASWALSTVPAGMGAHSGGACPSASACYAPSADDQGVLRSTNGGHTFTFTAIDTPEEQVNSIVNIACKSASTCVLTGTFPNSGSVADDEPLEAATADSGLSWEGGSGPQVAGWAACTPTRCMEASTLISTIDHLGSFTWTVRLSIVAGGTAIGLACFDTTHCIQNSEVGASYSSDGGQTWRTSTNLPTGLSFPLVGAPACVSGLHCFLAQNTADFNPPEFYQIVETTNGGASWHGSGPASAQYMACPTSTHCIGLDNPGDDNVEVDWTPTNGWVQNSVSPPAPGPITCAASTRCYLINPHGSFVTTNQGASWSALPSHPITRIACVDAMHCLATSGSNIQRTTNGGHSWSTVLAHARLLTCNAAGRCLGQTSSGIVDSTNSGSNWHSDNVTAALPFGSDARCRGSFCVIVGDATLRTP